MINIKLFLVLIALALATGAGLATLYLRHTEMVCAPAKSQADNGQKPVGANWSADTIMRYKQ